MQSAATLLSTKQSTVVTIGDIYVDMPLLHGMDITVTRYCVQLSAKQSTVVTIDIEEQG